MEEKINIKGEKSTTINRKDIEESDMDEEEKLSLSTSINEEKEMNKSKKI